MRKDFVHGTLVDDMKGYKLFAHVIQGQYAGRVKCMSSYDSVSKDITARWAHPIVPDANIFLMFDSVRGCMTPQSYDPSSHCYVRCSHVLSGTRFLARVFI
jgi:hypothetical protein